MFNFKNPLNWFIWALSLCLIFATSTTVGTGARVVAELGTVGHADCRSWSPEQAMTVCSSAPKWMHFKGGTQVGNVFITSQNRDALTDSFINHESKHKDQWNELGLLFIPYYFSALITQGSCNNIEFEAGYIDGNYNTICKTPFE